METGIEVTFRRRFEKLFLDAEVLETLKTAAG